MTIYNILDTFWDHLEFYHLCVCQIGWTDSVVNYLKYFSIQMFNLNLKSVLCTKYTKT